MTETVGKSFAQRWEDQQRRLDDYHPPKTLWLWSSLGSVALVVSVGFTFGG